MFVLACFLGQNVYSKNELPVKPKNEIWVMVIDSGIDYHPKLADHVQYQDNIDYRGTHVTPHGTHIAGIVVHGSKMATDGFKDTVCSQVKVFSCNYIRSHSTFWVKNATECVKRATAMKVDYINSSFGGGDFDENEYLSYKNFVASGGIVYVAAGNHKNDLTKVPYYPASYAVPGRSYKPLGGMVVVSNIDKDGKLVDSSNHWIGATKFVGKDILSTALYGKFGFMTGTSQSAPGALHKQLMDRCSKLKK